MNWSTQAAAIRSRFATLVATPQSLTTVYDNEADRDAHTDTLWCRFSVLPGARQYVETPNLSRTPGIAYAQLFCRVGAETNTIHDMADTVAASFQRTRADDVRWLTPRVVVVGSPGNSKWYQVNVEMAFIADDTQ